MIQLPSSRNCDMGKSKSDPILVVVVVVTFVAVSICIFVPCAPAPLLNHSKWLTIVISDRVHFNVLAQHNATLYCPRYYCVCVCCLSADFYIYHCHTKTIRKPFRQQKKNGFICVRRYYTIGLSVCVYVHTHRIERAVRLSFRVCICKIAGKEQSDLTQHIQWKVRRYTHIHCSMLQWCRCHCCRRGVFFFSFFLAKNKNK